MAIDFDDDDLVRELDAHTFDKGLDVWRQGLVRRVEVSPDGSRISGSVSGTKRAPYSQTISLADRNGRLRITGYCTCPMAFNCKHVAAILHDIYVQRDMASAAAERKAAGDDSVDTRSPAERALAARPRTATAPSRPEATSRPPSTPAASSSVGAISTEVAKWLEGIAPVAAPLPAPINAVRAAAKPPDRHLRYLLNPDRPPDAPAAMAPYLRPEVVKLRKDGSVGDHKPYDPDNIARPPDQRPRFLSPDDEMVLRDLSWSRRWGSGHGSASIRLSSDPTDVRAFDGALATGRMHFGEVDGPALTIGPEIAATPVWSRTDDGRQRLRLTPSAADAAFDAVLPFSPPRYVDLRRGWIGVITCDLAPSLLDAVVRAPAISPSEASLVRQALATRAVGGVPQAPAGALPEAEAATAPPAVLPLPEAPDDIEVRTIRPVPRLELLMTEATLKQSHLYFMLPGDPRRALPLPIARLSFNYGGTIVANADPRSTLQSLEGGRLTLTPRDGAAELAAADRLKAMRFRLIGALPFKVPTGHERDLFLHPPGNPSIYDLLKVFDDPDRFFEFSHEGVPALVAEGWEIAYADGYPYRLAEGEVEWWADAGEGAGIDWFSFELGIEFEGHRINLVPQLVNIIAQLPPQAVQALSATNDPAELAASFGQLIYYHQLADGRMLRLPGARLAPMLRMLFELVGPRGDRLAGGKVKLHRAEAALLAEIAEGIGRDVTWAASTERLVALGKDLRRGGGLVPVTPPATFKASLRPYQSEGLSWLEFLRGAGFGGVLADDMGLGKTVQALAFLTREKAEGRLDKPALIIAPTSVLPNWQAEAERFAPDLKVLALRGLDRKALFAEIPAHDLVLTTYPLLARDHAVLLEHEFHAAILDEAQAIKNPKATVSGLAHRLNARHRYALTGTPLENNLGEVWSLFQFLSPGLLGDETTFRRTFRTPIEKHGDQTAQAFLSRRLKPFMLRRTKAEVAKELPPKTEIVEHIRLEGPQRDLYEVVRALMHEKVREEIDKKGLAKSHIIFLDALLKLRQICCDPRLLKMPQAKKVKGSAKLERLMEMIPELVGEGRRILLFSQFTSMLALIEDELKALKIPYVQLTGQTTDRAAPVKDFQAGKVPLFLLSLKAGGTGLNLTAADTVIHYDPWWNPAVERQATDRAYRIGQDKPVFVYKLIVEEGIEAAIEQLKARKAALAEALFAGASKAPLDLTEADISALFAPLGEQPRKASLKRKAA